MSFLVHFPPHQHQPPPPPVTSLHFHYPATPPILLTTKFPFNLTLLILPFPQPLLPPHPTLSPVHLQHSPPPRPLSHHIISFPPHTLIYCPSHLHCPSPSLSSHLFSALPHLTFFPSLHFSFPQFHATPPPTFSSHSSF